MVLDIPEILYFYLFFCSVCILIYLVTVKLRLDYWKERL